MPIELSRDRARLLRLCAQRLASDDPSESSVVSVVHDCIGLQAQDSRQAPLGVRARGHGVTAADVDSARAQTRSIVRTWCIRGTIHYVTTADLPALLSLFGPLYVDRGQRRLAELGFDADESDRAVTAVRDALADHGPLTRTEVADHLLSEGFTFDPDGQAPVHVVRRACLEGVACEAAPRDGEETYGLLEDWVSLDPAPDREDALADLARRYVAAYEPTTMDDFYAWSGLYKRDVRTGWEAVADELIEVEIDGDRAWILSDPETVDTGRSPIVRLLPMYDSYFLGHEDRDLVLPDEYADQVYPGGGVIRAAVVVDGLATGTWTLDRSGKTAVVRVDPFESVASTVEAEIEREVADVGRFFDLDVTLEIV